MSDQMTTIDPIDDETNEAPKGDRRSALRKLALGGAGAAVGVLALNETANAGDSAGIETDGNALELGDLANTSDAPTGIQQAGELTDYSAFSVWEDDPATIGTNILPAAIGGYGSESVATGVHGSTVSGDGFGVVAANLAPAVDETPVPDDPEAATLPAPAAPAALVVSSANGPQIKFSPIGTPVSGPTPGTHVPGELYVDADGTLWFTVPIPVTDIAAEPGVRFVKLAGAANTGALETLAFPIRVSDSREGDDAVKPGPDSVTEVDLTTKLDGTPSGLASGATAALLNITIANSDDKGFFSVAATGVETPDAEVFSNGNWTQAGTNLGTSVTTAISTDGKISITLGPEGGTHLIVDLVGFYL